VLELPVIVYSCFLLKLCDPRLWIPNRFADACVSAISIVCFQHNNPGPGTYGYPDRLLVEAGKKSLGKYGILDRGAERTVQTVVRLFTLSIWHNESKPNLI